MLFAPRMDRKLPLPCAVFATLLLACGTDSVGALKQASASSDTGLEAVAPLAVGATASLDFGSSVAGTTTMPLTLESALPHVMKVDGTSSLTALKSGFSTVLLRTSDNKVFDFFTYYAAVATELRLRREDDSFVESGRIGLIQGKSLDLIVEPRRSTTHLSGSFPTAWSSSSDAVSILEDGHPLRRTIVARNVGTSTVTVKALNIETQVVFEVVP